MGDTNQTEYCGRVVFANDLPAQGVQVRVFDRDKPGKIDDDLTITPGVSDGQGLFSVCFDPSRFQDLQPSQAGNPFAAIFQWFNPEKDKYLPYLLFTYTENGAQQQIDLPLQEVDAVYHLPASAPLHFKPSMNGFHFINSFKGFPLPMSIPGLAQLTNVSDSYGLCGGMSASAYDFLLAGREVPADTTPPATGSPLHQYLFRRAVDTFGAFGSSVAQVARWTVLPDDTLNGIRYRTVSGVKDIMAMLDEQRATVTCLVYEKASSPSELAARIWDNHQVLAYGYTVESSGAVEISIYDSNYPDNDDVRVRCEVVEVIDPPQVAHGYICKQTIPGRVDRLVRGLFPMTYRSIEPPETF